MAVFHLCLLTLLVAYTKGSYVFSNSIVAAGGDYNVSYNFNASADTLEFLVEVRATGWVGFGFALTAPNNMTNYDVAVGGVLSNGSGYLAVRKSALALGSKVLLIHTHLILSRRKSSTV